MDVVFTCNSRDFHSRLSTYKVVKKVETASSVTTLDGVEHFVQRTRDIVEFSLIPYSDAEATADYNALSQTVIYATFTDPYINASSTKEFRLATDLDAIFGLRSVNGNRYYKGGTIKLRSIQPNET